MQFSPELDKLQDRVRRYVNQMCGKNFVIASFTPQLLSAGNWVGRIALVQEGTGTVLEYMLEGNSLNAPITAQAIARQRGRPRHVLPSKNVLPEAESDRIRLVLLTMHPDLHERDI